MATPKQALERYYAKDRSVLNDLLGALTALANQSTSTILEVETLISEYEDHVVPELHEDVAGTATPLFYTSFFLNSLNSAHLALKAQLSTPVVVVDPVYARTLVKRIDVDFFPTRTQYREHIKGLTAIVSQYEVEPPAEELPADPSDPDFVAYVTSTDTVIQSEFNSGNSRAFSALVARRNSFMIANGLPVPSSTSSASVDTHMDTVSSVAAVALVGVGVGLLSVFA